MTRAAIHWGVRWAGGAVVVAGLLAGCGRLSTPVMAPPSSVAPPATWEGAPPDLPCAATGRSQPAAPVTVPTGGWFRAGADRIEVGVNEEGRSAYASLLAPTPGLDRRAAAVLALLPAGFTVRDLDTSQQATCDGPTLRVMRWDAASFERTSTGESASVRWTTLTGQVDPVPWEYGMGDVTEVHTLADGAQWASVDLDGRGTVRSVYLAARDGRMVVVRAAGRGSEQYNGWPTTMLQVGPTPEPSSIDESAALGIARRAVDLS